MEINVSKQPAIAPASFGMPGYAHTFETSSVVRARRALATGDMGIATTTVPGTSAWRPPSS